MNQEVEVEPYQIFGLCRKERNNLFFLDEQTIIFPSGNNCVLYNVHQRSTKFIPVTMVYGMGKQGIQALAISPDQRYLAVSEYGAEGVISVYDFKWQALSCGEFDVQKFICMAFSADSKYLLCQSGGPKWILFYWEWENDEIIAMVKTTRLGFVSQVSFNPIDNTKICVSGKYVFQIFHLENDYLIQTSMFNHSISCHAWLSEESIVLGTEEGRLLLFQDGDWYSLMEPSERQVVKTDSLSTDALSCITAITVYTKGFACAEGPGVVYLYEKTGECGYKKDIEIKIPQDICSNELSQSLKQEIKAMCLNPSEEMLAVSTRQGQIYLVNLSSVEINQCKQANFEHLLHSLHSESITGLSVCSSKPLLATCSWDNSMCIWNYQTNSLEMCKELSEDPTCISVHPNGLSILVGFSDKVCLMNLLVEEFQTVQEFNIHNCNECVFNHNGNMFAAVSDNLISIFDIRTGEKVDLNGHINTLVMWSEDDRCLVSFETDGAVCEWNVLTGDCKIETMQKFCAETLTVDENNKYMTQRKILREMALNSMSYTSISMTHSGQAGFVGTSAGTIRVMQYLLEEEISWTEHQAHSGPITKMVVTPDDQYLVTASEDSSLLIWSITYQERHELSMLKESCLVEELFCTKGFLEKQDQSILDTQAQMELLEQDREYKLDQNHKLDKNRENFLLEQNKALQGQIEMLNIEKEAQKVSREKALTEIREKNAEELKKNESKHADELFQAVAVQEILTQKIVSQHQELQADKETCKNLKDKIQLMNQEKTHLQNIIEKHWQNKAAFIRANSQLNELIKQLSRLMGQTAETEVKKGIKETQRFFRKPETEMEINTKHQEAIRKLTENLRVKENELCTVRQKIRNIKVVMERMKANFQTCSGYKCYNKEGNVKTGVKMAVQEQSIRQKLQLQRAQRESQTFESRPPTPSFPKTQTQTFKLQPRQTLLLKTQTQTFKPWPRQTSLPKNQTQTVQSKFPQTPLPKNQAQTVKSRFPQTPLPKTQTFKPWTPQTPLPKNQTQTFKPWPPKTSVPKNQNQTFKPWPPQTPLPKNQDQTVKFRFPLTPLPKTQTFKPWTPQTPLPKNQAQTVKFRFPLTPLPKTQTFKPWTPQTPLPKNQTQTFKPWPPKTSVPKNQTQTFKPWPPQTPLHKTQTQTVKSRFPQTPLPKNQAQTVKSRFPQTPLPKTQTFKPWTPQTPLPKTQTVKSRFPQTPLPKTQTFKPLPPQTPLPKTQTFKPLPPQTPLPKTQTFKPLPPQTPLPKTQTQTVKSRFPQTPLPKTQTFKPLPPQTPLPKTQTQTVESRFPQTPLPKTQTFKPWPPQEPFSKKQNQTFKLRPPQTPLPKSHNCKPHPSQTCLPKTQNQTSKPSPLETPLSKTQKSTVSAEDLKKNHQDRTQDSQITMTDAYAGISKDSQQCSGECSRILPCSRKERLSMAFKSIKQDLAEQQSNSGDAKFPPIKTKLAGKNTQAGFTLDANQVENLPNCCSPLCSSFPPLAPRCSSFQHLALQCSSFPPCNVPCCPLWPCCVFHSHSEPCCDFCLPPISP